MSPMRIISFLPAATEMIFALGLGDQLVGVSHECDFPPVAREKPAVVQPALKLEGMDLREIDEAVSSLLTTGASLYRVGEKQLRSLAPDLIITQDLCQVCAPSGNQIAQVLQSLPQKPQVLSLTPHSLSDVFDNLSEIGKATGCVASAERLITDYRSRLESVFARTKSLQKRPRVFCCEWVDPIYGGGHWIPEMVALAGGVDTLSHAGGDSMRISWEDVLRWSPEILIINPCGFDLENSVTQARLLYDKPGWHDLPAVQQNQVFAVDANAYFARPGPRLIDGVELLAHLFHPEIFEWDGPTNAFRRVPTS